MNRQTLLNRWQVLVDELARENVRLLAVSKYAPDEAVRWLIEAGQMDFGESRPQNLRDRAQRYPTVRWHMIGPLQKNKAKYIARHAAAWHSVEDIETACAVAALVSGRRLPVLVQVNVAGLPHQHGVHPDALPALCHELQQLPQLCLAGLMCMAPREGDARICFSRLRGLRDALPDGSLCGPDACKGSALEDVSLCMGMSGDFHVAIAEGTDMVRLGSGLFPAG